MKIKLNNKDINIILANNFLIRLKGLTFKKNINYGLYFKKCNSIHTFFMKDEIDIIMLDKNNKILFLYPNFKKNKILIKKEVYNIIELPKNSINSLKVNDYINLC